MTRLILMAAAAATLLMGAPAAAQPTSPPSDPNSRALIVKPLTLTKVQDLDFGTIIANPTQSITVVIDPFTGGRATSHPAQMVASDAGQRGEFAGAGTVGQPVIMQLTPPTSLSDGAGNSLTVVTLFMDGAPVRIIGPQQYFFVNIGGVIQVPANAPGGVYSSLYQLTADYQ